MQEYQTLLISELDKRKRTNPLYSLRSFARFLEISPSQLSQLIHGKRNLNRKHAVRIAKKLELSPMQAQRILGSTLQLSQNLISNSTHSRILEDDEFRLIADWYHFAILSLASIQNNKNDIKWIALRLGVSNHQALDAFERLKRLRLIEIQGAGFRPSQRSLETSTDVPSSASRHYHKQNLDLAKEKLEAIPLDKRDFSSITMAVNPNKIKRAKELIAEFKQLMADELEIRPQTEVYALNIQLFPLTLQENKK